LFVIDIFAGLASTAFNCLIICIAVLGNRLRSSVEL